MFEEATLFSPEGTALAAGSSAVASEVVDLRYNGDAVSQKAFVAVQATEGTGILTVALQTSDTEDFSDATTLTTWAAKPDDNGYVVKEKIPFNLKRYLRLAYTCTEAFTVIAGITFGVEQPYNPDMVDPATKFTA